MRSVRILFKKEDLSLVGLVYEQLKGVCHSFLCSEDYFKRYLDGQGYQWLCVDRDGYVFTRGVGDLNNRCAGRDESPINFTEIPLYSLLNQENV